MICPVEIASEMSAFKVGHGRGSCRRGHEKLLWGRRGTGDENPRSFIAGDGEEDHVVAGGGNHRDIGPEHEAGAVRAARLRRVVRPAAREAESEVRAPATGGAMHHTVHGGAGAGVVPGEILRSERAAFSREAASGARHPAELHVGEEGAPARGASEAAAAPAAAGHAAAHRRQQAWVVPG